MSMTIHFDLDETKAIQVLGVMAKVSHGSFDYYRAMKAIYALDRAALIRWGQPIVGGTYKMLKYGPVNQSVMDAIKPGRQGFFSTCFSRSGNTITITCDPGTDELSQAEILLAKEVCSEWPQLDFNDAHEKASSFPECNQLKPVCTITPEQLLAAAGKTQDEIDAVAAECAVTHLIMQA